MSGTAPNFIIIIINDYSDYTGIVIMTIVMLNTKKNHCRGALTLKNTEIQKQSWQMVNSSNSTLLHGLLMTGTWFIQLLFTK